MGNIEKKTIVHYNNKNVDKWLIRPQKCDISKKKEDEKIDNAFETGKEPERAAAVWIVLRIRLCYAK